MLYPDTGKVVGGDDEQKGCEYYMICAVINLVRNKRSVLEEVVLTGTAQHLIHIFVVSVPMNLRRPPYDDDRQ